VGKRVQAAEAVGPQSNQAEPGHHPPPRRRPPGRKPGPAPDSVGFGRQLLELLRHCFPLFNLWLDALPDARVQELCVYLGRHLWWQPILMFLLRDGSRNAFDGDRNSGQLPLNMTQLTDAPWDRQRLGERRTVTCSGNVTHHLSRTPVSAVAQLLLRMLQRLWTMRMMEGARLLDHWWLIVVDGTLQDRGRKTKKGEARYRYVVEAKLVGPEGSMFAVMTEFANVRDPLRDKEDCELKAFLRLAARLHAAFPRRPICLLLDGLFCGEISPSNATLWVWVTNIELSARNVEAVANRGGRRRELIESVFNVEKNGGFGLEHAFCADDTAAENYHLIMQVAHVLEQLLVNGLFRRLTRACRKLTDTKLIELLRTSLLTIAIDPQLPAFGQLRFIRSTG
jgi:hypothetical protein